MVGQKNREKEALDKEQKEYSIGMITVSEMDVDDKIPRLEGPKETQKNEGQLVPFGTLEMINVSPNQQFQEMQE